MPSWPELSKLSVPERIERLKDPAFRRKLDEGAHSEGAGLLRGLANWERMIVDQVARPEHEHLKGRLIGDIAEEIGKTPFDTMIDLAISENLKTSFMPSPIGLDDASWKLRESLARQPRGRGRLRCGRASRHDRHVRVLDGALGQGAVSASTRRWRSACAG